MSRKRTNKTELTSRPDLTHARQAGIVRTKRPLYIDRLSPCNAACPVGEHVQHWLALLQQRAYRAAWESIMQDNPLPATHGRVCYHPCEGSCNRASMDATVNIHLLERWLGDHAIEQGWAVEPLHPSSGKRVMIVGAGPSGLSAAYHLVRLGHAVTTFEAAPLVGGMMRFGIPAYRLPRNILAAEVNRIEQMGVRFVCNHRITDLLAEKKAGHYDAVFVAVGAHLSQRTELPSTDASRVMDAVSFLRSVEAGDPPKLGRRVAVYGGGNTAMDTARTAQRLGAQQTLVIYRRDRAHMPAHEEEAEEVEQEGIEIHWLRTIKQLDQGACVVEKMELDHDGKPKPTGTFETLQADTVIMALGQKSDTEFLHKVPELSFTQEGTVVVDEHFMTAHAGLFAGGDMVPSERTIAVATGHGKRAATYIHAYLMDKPPAARKRSELATVDLLRPWFYTDANKKTAPTLDLKNRQTTFNEVVQGLERNEAVYEARRCLSCGICFECDGCYGACPEEAIVKRGTGLRYSIDYTKCTGCGICVEQCPCAAIKMIPEPGQTDP